MARDSGRRTPLSPNTLTAKAGSEETERERRRARVAILHAAMRSVREIADELGVGKSTVQADIEAIRDEWRHEYALTYDQHASNALRRLRALERGIMPAALNGDPRAVMAALGIHDREASLLGYNKPVRIQTSTSIEFRAHLSEEIEQLVARLREAPPAIDVGSSDGSPG